MKISVARGAIRADVLRGDTVTDRARSTALLRRALWMLMLLALARGLCYALITPPWEAPDETGHFEYVWTMAQTGGIPSAQDASPQFERALVRSLYQYHYQDYNPGQVLPNVIPDRIGDLAAHVARARTLLWGRFSLSYVLPSLLVFPFRNSDIVTQLYIARLASIILNIAILLIAFLTFQEISPAAWRSNILAVALIAFMPYHTFINSTAGDGTFAELIACAVIYCWTRLFKRGPGVWELAGILLGLVLSLWTKATILFLIPGSALLAAYWLLTQPRYRRFVLLFALGCGLLLCAVLALAATSGQFNTYLASSSVKILARYGIKPQSLGSIDFRTPLEHTFNSFLANFGDTAFSVSSKWHILFRLLCLAAVAGWIFGRHGDDPINMVVIMWVFLLTALFGLVVWGVILYNNYAQGRYLLPVIVPFSFLFLHGLVRLAPPPLQLRAGTLLVLGMAMFDLWCIVGYIIPYFFA